LKFGLALVADMTDADIKAFIGGKTGYMEITAASASGTASQTDRDLLARGWYGALQTPSGAHHAWQMEYQRQQAVH
jgi:hypothetical protein